MSKSDIVRSIRSALVSPVEGPYEAKITYDKNGVVYNPNDDKFYYYEYDDDWKLSEFNEATPIAVFLPLDGDKCYVDEDSLYNLCDCNFSGEADDLSCYVYFNF